MGQTVEDNPVTSDVYFKILLSLKRSSLDRYISSIEQSDRVDEIVVWLKRCGVLESW
jgi:hypothetical protein